MRMVDCLKERVRSARQRVIDTLATYRSRPSETALASLQAAVHDWEKSVESFANFSANLPKGSN